MKRVKVQLTNQRFGKLFVLEQGPILNRRTSWKCKCDCGNISYPSTYALTKGNTNSCGCNRKVRKHLSKLWRGIGDMSASVWSSIKNKAKSRNLIVNISFDFIWKLFLKQNRKCALSGQEIYFKSKKDKTISLDRIDNSKGYTEDNVQWVHKDINWMKQDFDEKYFIKTCSLIHNEVIKKELILMLNWTKDILKDKKLTQEDMLELEELERMIYAE